jgi:hypothetical protein
MILTPVRRFTLIHPQEEVWQIIEGEPEITIDGVAHLWVCRNHPAGYPPFRKGDLGREGYRRGLSIAPISMTSLHNSK